MTELGVMVAARTQGGRISYLKSFDSSGTWTLPCLNVSTSFLEIHCMALAEILVPKLRSNGDGAPPFSSENTETT